MPFRRVVVAQARSDYTAVGAWDRRASGAAIRMRPAASPRFVKHCPSWNHATNARFHGRSYSRRDAHSRRAVPSNPFAPLLVFTGFRCFYRVPVFSPIPSTRRNSAFTESQCSPDSLSKLRRYQVPGARRTRRFVPSYTLSALLTAGLVRGTLPSTCSCCRSGLGECGGARTAISEVEHATECAAPAIRKRGLLGVDEQASKSEANPYKPQR